MHCRACTASCYQMAVTAIVAGERYSLVCFCWACSVHVLAPICQTAFVAPRPHERELSGHERSTCAAVHALPAATRWQSQLSSLASATYLFAGHLACVTRLLHVQPGSSWLSAAHILIASAYTKLLPSRLHARPPACLLYTSPSPRDLRLSRMPSSA